VTNRWEPSSSSELLEVLKNGIEMIRNNTGYRPPTCMIIDLRKTWAIEEIKSMCGCDFCNCRKDCCNFAEKRKN